MRQLWFEIKVYFTLIIEKKFGKTNVYENINLS